MNYFKIVSEDNKVVAVGTNYGEEDIGVRISKIDYIHISERFVRASSVYGKKPIMDNDTYEIEFVDADVPDDQEIPTEVAMNIILGKM